MIAPPGTGRVKVLRNNGAAGLFYGGPGAFGERKALKGQRFGKRSFTQNLNRGNFAADFADEPFFKKTGRRNRGIFLKAPLQIFQIYDRDFFRNPRRAVAAFFRKLFQNIPKLRTNSPPRTRLLPLDSAPGIAPALAAAPDAPRLFGL